MDPLPLDHLSDALGRSWIAGRRLLVLVFLVLIDALFPVFRSLVVTTVFPIRKLEALLTLKGCIGPGAEEQFEEYAVVSRRIDEWQRDLENLASQETRFHRILDAFIDIQTERGAEAPGTDSFPPLFVDALAACEHAYQAHAMAEQWRAQHDQLDVFRAGAHYAYHADGLGSITCITDAVQASVRAHRYDAWGKATTDSGTLPNPFLVHGAWAVAAYGYSRVTDDFDFLVVLDDRAVRGLEGRCRRWGRSPSDPRRGRASRTAPRDGCPISSLNLRGPSNGSGRGVSAAASCE